MAYVPPHRRCKTITPVEEIPSIRNAFKQGSSYDHGPFVIFCNAFSRIYCINLESRPDKWEQFLLQSLRIGPEFQDKIERFNAINGQAALDDDDESTCCSENIKLEWDTTRNAQWDRHVEPGMLRTMTSGEVGCALSHIALWRELASSEKDDSSMLIFEDDATFLLEKKDNLSEPRSGQCHLPRANRFVEAFSKVWSSIPEDWGILYLGFSDRGKRTPVEERATTEKGQGRHAKTRERLMQVDIFRPTYGFHTHAYAITKKAAVVVLQNLPVAGPLDVWLADNNWFGLPVYCTSVANEGWRGTGAPLVHQCKDAGSDVGMSSRSKPKDCSK